jgi:serpin B
VKQKATLTVDSKGTTATAATAVGEAMASLRAGRELVKLDHPYLFLVRDTKTGAIMFAAQINDPRH